MTRNDLQGIAFSYLLSDSSLMHSDPQMRYTSLKLLSIIAITLGLLFLTTPSSYAERLTSQTTQAFERYLRANEARMDEEIANQKHFLWIDTLPEPSRTRSYGDLKRGQTITQHNAGCASNDCASIPGGLIHNWIGIVFVPGISMSQALNMLQNYDRDAEYYHPQVLKSKLLEHAGNHFRVFLRLKQVQVITVVMDTEYDVTYTPLDATHAYSRSYSTRIAEVESVGEPHERDRPVGDDHGFLWRLNSYWRFYQADGGTYIQCQAISLSRDVPAGLGWIVSRFIEDIPSESLRFTLDATRAALLRKATNNENSSHGEKDFNK